MFKNYLASKDDLDAVNEALRYVSDQKLKFVFKDKFRIENTLIISYDSKFIYIWKINPVKLTFKISHNLEIPDEWQSGWWSNLAFKKIEKYLPVDIKKSTRFEIPIISGGFLNPFIELQKKKGLPNNPYTTKESYLATIVHEFGHVYWNSYKLWWFSKKETNIKNLKMAQELYGKSENYNKKTILNLPHSWALSEVFAFCAEYNASHIFWKKHKKNIDTFTSTYLDSLIILEKNKNLDKENSVIEPTTSPHNFASVFGKIILTKNPKNWPTILTQQIILFNQENTVV